MYMLTSFYLHVIYKGKCINHFGSASNLRIYVRIYVCMHLCMHLCMYVCMHLCRYLSMYTKRSVHALASKLEREIDRQRERGGGVWKRERRGGLLSIVMMIFRDTINFDEKIHFNEKKWFINDIIKKNSTRLHFILRWTLTTEAVRGEDDIFEDNRSLSKGSSWF